MTQTAKIYGSGLYDLAKEEGISEVVMQQLREIRTLFQENPEYVKLLGEPSIPKAERVNLIDTAFGTQVEHYLLNFMKLLCEHNIMNEFGGCCDEFTGRYNVDHNITEATVWTPYALTDDQFNALKAKLESMSGKHVNLTQKLDQSAIAGLRVELDGKMLDGTIRGRITGISKKLDEIIE